MSKIDEFNEHRLRMNEVILSEAPLEVKRFFSLDKQAYGDGNLSAKTKELIGLACSMVLRCDDSVTYHLQQLVGIEASDEEIWESMSIALIVGGSIVIPHIRGAVERMKELRSSAG